MSYIPFLHFGYVKPDAELTVLKSPVAEADRRKEPRYPSDGSARVLVPFLFGPLTFNACVLDVSKSGMRLNISAPLAPGTLVQVELKNLVATGAVRHCRRDEEGYSMGIQLDAVVNKDKTV